MRVEPTGARQGPLPGSPRPGRDLSRPLPAALSWTVLAVFLGAFAIAFVALDLPWWLPAWYGTLSLASFTAYAADKSAARRGAPRMSEQSLLTMGLAGGWPGALAAQQLFRHKTRKRAFRRAFWATIVVNVLLLGALVVGILSMPGQPYSAILQ
jgi:uncharacterized membrane protein YsdA (DUF1294 family)